MIVFSNTSPIINLAAIGRLELLRRLFGTIIIPPAVHREIVINGAGEPGSWEVASSIGSASNPLPTPRWFRHCGFSSISARPKPLLALSNTGRTGC